MSSKEGSAQLKLYSNFLFEVGKLSRTQRSGLRYLSGLQQSVAEHLLRTAYIGMVLAELESAAGKSVNEAGVLFNCIVHDLGEARTGDLDYVSQKYSETDELRAVRDAVKDLPFGDRIISAFIETENRLTTEGIIAKDADSLEFLFSLKEVIDSGDQRALRWIGPLLKRLRTESALQLAQVIIHANSHDWWMENKDDIYWIDGGKKNKEPPKSVV